MADSVYMKKWVVPTGAVKMVRRTKSTWQIAQIEATKSAIKDELEKAATVGGIKARMDAIQGGIRKYEDEHSPTGHLRLFVYIVSALVHHMRHGGLKDQQINKLMDLAYAVLKFQGVQSETSKLGYLYGELHLALSQIYRKSGHHWSASWEQQLASYLSGRNVPGGPGFQALSIGIRAQRLGHLGQAMTNFDMAEAANPAIEHFEKARIGRIRCLRLSARFADASRLVAETQTRPDLTERFKLELSWEVLCLAASTTGDLKEMIAAVERDQAHGRLVYAAEAFLWSNAVTQRHWVKCLPKVRSMVRAMRDQVPDNDLLIKAATVIENLYDDDIPYVNRLRSLGKLIEQAHRSIAIDYEMLIYLAAARWLSRTRSSTLAATALWEYRSLSLTLSEGADGDVMRVAGDMLERPWFKASA